MRIWLILLCLLATDVSAQEHPSTASEPQEAGNEIVVVGRETSEKQVSDFVKGLTWAPHARTIARFEGEWVCPLAFGLSVKYNRLITERMRKVARAAGVGLAAEPCTPNALVIFADDKLATVRQLERERPQMFPEDRVRLSEEPGPAIAWRVLGKIDLDGVRAHGIVARTTRPASRLVELVRPIFDLSVVVIERDAIEGFTTVQVADYAAMRVLTTANPARAQDSGAPTILSIMTTPKDQPAPVTLTTWDLSFLRSLYALPVGQSAAAQRGMIGDSMRRDFGTVPVRKP
ncbi:hypothetical protein TPR58_15170 [Sphingomonas sp. HF-S3]|uniref:DUF2927 domain-containing protein n=1 Tax=Sphingomonas rustica TaxID=3103142 RepID=A0ABV0BBF1_9SPHN